MSSEHEEVGVIEDIEDSWGENKYEPQQQEEYLQALKQEVCPCPVTYIMSSYGDKGLHVS